MNSFEILLVLTPVVLIWFGSLYFVWYITSPLVTPLYKYVLHDRSVPHPSDPNYHYNDNAGWN